MVLFLIHPVQFGMSELWFVRYLVEDAGADGWMGIIIAGSGVHILLWMMYSILKKGKGSAVAINRDVFGKWVGGGISLTLIVFFVFEGISIVRSYAEIVEVFLFPGIETWLIAIMILILVYYAVGGGFRVVVGICFWGFFLPFITLTPVLVAPLEYAHFGNLLPIMTHPVSDLLKAGKDMSMAFIGFEGLLISYPFIKKADSSQKWAHASNLFTTLFYLLIAVISIAYFNKALIQKFIWPKLDLVELTHVTFLQGFQYIFISLWLLVILPNVTYAVWVASRGAKELFSVQQRKLLPVIVIVIFLVVIIFTKHKQIGELNHAVYEFGFFFISLYLPILWVIQRMKGRWGRSRKVDHT